MEGLLPRASREAARRAVDALALKTPLLLDAALSARLQRPVWLKLEQLQPGGSYKIRPAAASLGALSPEARARGVVAASGGNFGVSLALAARALGVRARIVMPAESIAEKQRQLAGAEVLPGPAPGYDAAEDLARQIAHEEGIPFLSPTEGEAVYLGSSTIAEEILAEQPATSLLIASVGGGGLALGLAEAAAPRGAKVLGVSPEAANAMALSLREGRAYLRHDSGETWAEPLMGGVPEENFQRARRTLDGVLSVPEEDIRAAARALYRERGLWVEPAGAVPYALARFGRLPGDGPVVLVLSGGNLSIERQRALAAL